MKQRWLGWLGCLFCVVMLFIWIPLDVDTGIIEKVRRQVSLGDAFAPSVAALIIGLGGLLLLIERQPALPQLDNKADNKPGNKSPNDSNHDSHDQSTGLPLEPGIADIKHAALVLLIVTVSLLLMRYAGPFLLNVIEGGDAEYRLLRDTVPWKYIGFITGGVFIIVSFIALCEQRLQWQHFLIALVAVAILIAFYDLPFEDLLLPPNGDV